MDKVRITKMETINKGDLTLNDEKKKFLHFSDIYRGKIRTVSTSIEILELIGKNEDVYNLYKYYPGFMNTFMENAWHASVTILSSIFSHSSNEENSIFKFLNYIKSNHNKIFTGEFCTVIKYSDGRIEEKPFKINGTACEDAKECETLITENEDIIKIIDAFRDEEFAHLGNGKKIIDLELKIEDLRKVLNLFSVIYNKFRNRYDLTSFVFSPTNSTDITSLAYLVSVYHKNETKINELIYHNK